MKCLYGFPEKPIVYFPRVIYTYFLLVVIGVVISFVGDAFRSLLNNRQELILSNLNEADRRAEKAQEDFNEAKLQFEVAKRKTVEIAEQALINLNKEKDNAQLQTEEMIRRLEKLKEEALLSQQKKALKSLSKEFIQYSLTQVQKKLQSRVDFKFQVAMTNFYIALIRNSGFLNKD